MLQPCTSKGRFFKPTILSRITIIKTDFTFENPYSVGGIDFIDLMTGRISGQSASFSGKLRVSGDLMLARRLESLFMPEDARVRGG